MTENFYANSQSVLGVAVETTRNTWVTPAFWIPVTSPQVSPMVTQVKDDALRGSMVLHYDDINTVRHDEYTFTTYCYLDTLPVFLRAILGSSDTKTGSAPSVSHVIGLNNSGGNGNQPPSLSLTDYDGYLYRKLTGAQMDELTIKFNATGLVELTCKFLANPFTTTAGPISTGFTALGAQPSWNCAANYAGSSCDLVVDGTVSLKRGVKPIHTLGTQGPRLLWAGPLDISGTGTFLKADDTFLTNYLTSVSAALTYVFTNPTVTTDILTIQMSTVKLEGTKDIRSSDELIETTTNLMPLPSSTDASAAANGGGVSPILVTVVNAQTAAY